MNLIYQRNWWWWQQDSNQTYCCDAVWEWLILRTSNQWSKTQWFAVDAIKLLKSIKSSSYVY